MAPLVDVVLRPGAVLYVPPGFPHDTQTTPEALHPTGANGNGNAGTGRARGTAADGEVSVHATVGCYARRLLIDYAGARYAGLVRAGLPPTSTGFVQWRRHRSVSVLCCVCASSVRCLCRVSTLASTSLFCPPASPARIRQHHHRAATTVPPPPPCHHCRATTAAAYDLRWAESDLCWAESDLCWATLRDSSLIGLARWCCAVANSGLSL